jgi:hypothetical protein
MPRKKTTPVAKLTDDGNSVTTGNASPAPVAARLTEYVTETRPQLPTADVSPTYPTPTIDPRLLDIRNAEAKRDADRLAASLRGQA